MWTWWEVFATFSGPAATVIAAGTAARITYKFANIQAGIARSQAATAEASKEIARSQRDIAYDKLKHDLFGKRYEIYNTARCLIEYISGNKFDGVHDPKIREMRLKLDEAKFFFPAKETKLFSRVEKLSAEYLIGEVERKYADDDHDARVTAANKMTDALKVLVDIHANLPELLKDELGFAQLTGAVQS